VTDGGAGSFRSTIPLLIAEPALTVEELLRQVGGTKAASRRGTTMP
jgi:hypothetical protein